MNETKVANIPLMLIATPIMIIVRPFFIVALSELATYINLIRREKYHDSNNADSELNINVEME